MNVPFFRVTLTESEITEVANCLRSGWLTTGPRAASFELKFAESVGAKYAVALNSGTAALHLAVEAVGLKAGQAVLVPTLTFAATAEVVRYLGAVPLLVDCDPHTLNMDLADARRKILDMRKGRSPIDPKFNVVGMIPVHVGGHMMDINAIAEFAAEFDLWVVEDATHAFPAAFRSSPERQFRRCGQNTADVSCFSFYANKTITTGEGGMAVTDDLRTYERIKCMSLHGLSQDVWTRLSDGVNWDYRILAAGYKYNMTDLAATLGECQLERAETLRQKRESIAHYFRDKLEDLEVIEFPANPSDRILSWQIFPIRLRLEQLVIDRDEFLQAMRHRGVNGSVHWRPLHLHPYYQDNFGWVAEDFPVATAQWQRLISLPLYPGMLDTEMEHVVRVVRQICGQYSVSHACSASNPAAGMSPAKPQLK